MSEATDIEVTATNATTRAIEPTVEPTVEDEPAGERRSNQSFLVFLERGVRYALPATSVREALRLPRLTALEETAPWVLGAFELRGELVPLLSPALCLRHPPTPAARLSDIAIVADCAGHPLAFLANEVIALSRPRRLLPVPTETNDDGRVIAYEIALDDGVARVLDPTRIRLHAVDAEEVADLPERRLDSFEEALDPAALQQLAVRAEQYSMVAGASAEQGHQTFVLLGIGGETFALPAADCLELVRIGPVVPVPCTPAHILGFSALRGEVVTVVDIRTALGLACTGLWEPPLMAVIRFGRRRTGIAVETALAINRLRLEPCEELPLALRASGETWLRGAIRPRADSLPRDVDSGLAANLSPGQRHPLPVIDIVALLDASGLVVDRPA